MDLSNVLIHLSEIQVNFTKIDHIVHTIVHSIYVHGILDSLSLSQLRSLSQYFLYPIQLKRGVTDSLGGHLVSSQCQAHHITTNKWEFYRTQIKQFKWSKYIQKQIRLIQTDQINSVIRKNRGRLRTRNGEDQVQSLATEAEWTCQKTCKEDRLKQDMKKHISLFLMNSTA